MVLRFFPYESATRWDLFMIDFSGKAVAATARQTGIEPITVPAGEFSCYRMEVIIHTSFQPDSMLFLMRGCSRPVVLP